MTGKAVGVIRTLKIGGSPDELKKVGHVEVVGSTFTVYAPGVAHGPSIGWSEHFSVQDVDGFEPNDLVLQIVLEAVQSELNKPAPPMDIDSLAVRPSVATPNELDLFFHVRVGLKNDVSAWEVSIFRLSVGRSLLPALSLT